MRSYLEYNPEPRAQENKQNELKRYEVRVLMMFWLKEVNRALACYCYVAKLYCELQCFCQGGLCYCVIINVLEDLW